MKYTLHLLQSSLRGQVCDLRANWKTYLERYGLKSLFILFALFIITKKDLSFQFNVRSADTLAAETTAAPDSDRKLVSYEAPPEMPVAVPVVNAGATMFERFIDFVLPGGGSRTVLAAAKNVSMLTGATTEAVKPKGTDNNLANTYSNMSYHGSKEAQLRAEKRKKQLAYVDKYLTVAQDEMTRYGIPVSITLAQGLIESNCGESRLSVQNNNHFGIKCFSKTCRKGHCSNFTDDSHKDFFRKYGSAKESFRSHSSLLQSKRYRKLYTLDRKDYKGWSHGLKAAGYATDKRYAEKLIFIIEDLGLQKYDK